MASSRGRRPGVLAAAVWIGAAGALVLLGIRADRAQTNELNVQFHTFQDTRGVTVLSPTADLTKDFTERTTLRASFGVDAISAASDSCARCHRDSVNSRRQVGSLSVTQKYNDWKLSAGGSFSKENFYRATTALMSVARDLAKGNATVASGYAFSLNQPTLHPLPTSANQFSHDAYVSLTQTLTRTTIAQAGYEVEHLGGYLDSPFLRTSLNGVMTLGHVPGTRLRQTLSLRVRQALPGQTFVSADYRRYTDSWQVTSNALTVGVSRPLGSHLEAAFDYRTYGQTGASFYEPSYLGTPSFYTGDFRLAPFRSGLYTGRVTITPSRFPLGLPAGTALTVQYERYRADNGFQAAIVSTGLKIPLGTR